MTEDPNPWKDALIDALVVANIYRREHEADPRQALIELIAWEVGMALNPLVSQAARDLVESGRPPAELAVCPFDEGNYPEGMTETDPCPVCGDTGEIGAVPSGKCPTTMERIAAMPWLKEDWTPPDGGPETAGSAIYKKP